MILRMTKKLTRRQSLQRARHPQNIVEVPQNQSYQILLLDCHLCICRVSVLRELVSPTLLQLAVHYYITGKVPSVIVGWPSSRISDGDSNDVETHHNLTEWTPRTKDLEATDGWASAD